MKWGKPLIDVIKNYKMVTAEHLTKFRALCKCTGQSYTHEAGPPTAVEFHRPRDLGGRGSHVQKGLRLGKQPSGKLSPGWDQQLCDSQGV